MIERKEMKKKDKKGGDGNERNKCLEAWDERM